jgi:ribonucleotide monophosphatase NagD (HAD superfamily)
MTRKSILRHLRHLIIDMDGVLYRGSEAVAGVGGFVDFLRRRGIRFALATNNSTRTPMQFVEKWPQTWC